MHLPKTSITIRHGTGASKWAFERAKLGFKNCGRDSGWIHPKACTHQTSSWTRHARACLNLQAHEVDLQMSVCYFATGIKEFKGIECIFLTVYTTGGDKKTTHYVTLTYILHTDAFCIYLFPFWPG